MTEQYTNSCRNDNFTYLPKDHNYTLKMKYTIRNSEIFISILGLISPVT